MDMTFTLPGGARVEANGFIERVALSIELPPEFPERYRSAVIRSAEQCSVKKHLEHPPHITIETVTPTPA